MLSLQRPEHHQVQTFGGADSLGLSEHPPGCLPELGHPGPAWPLLPTASLQKRLGLVQRSMNSKGAFRRQASKATAHLHSGPTSGYPGAQRRWQPGEGICPAIPEGEQGLGRWTSEMGRAMGLRKGRLSSRWMCLPCPPSLPRGPRLRKGSWVDSLSMGSSH